MENQDYENVEYEDYININRHQFVFDICSSSLLVNMTHLQFVASLAHFLEIGKSDCVGGQGFKLSKSKPSGDYPNLRSGVV